MKENNLKVAGFGYLVYVYPDQSPDLHNGFPMIIHVAKLSGNPQNTSQKIAHAIKVLETNMPNPAPECPFCNWYETIKVELGDKKLAKNTSKVKKQIIQNLELDFG